MNDKSIQFFVGLPDNAVNPYIVYTNNEFFMRMFMEHHNSGIIRSITGVYDYNIFSYMAHSEEEFLDFLNKDLSLDVSKNNCLELYCSNDDRVSIVLTSIMMEIVEIDYLYENFVKDSYILFNVLSGIKHLFNFSDNIRNMIHLMVNIYLPLIVTLNVVDLYTIRKSEFGRAVYDILKERRVSDPELFSIFDIINSTLLIYLVHAVDEGD